MDDNQILERGGTQEDINRYAEQNGATDPRSPADHKFLEFHNKNPQVYFELVKLAREAQGKGHRKISIELLFNVVRWERMMRTDDPNSTFKINNNYKSRYARMIMLNEPGLQDIFEVREMKS